MELVSASFNKQDLNKSNSTALLSEIMLFEKKNANKNPALNPSWTFLPLAAIRKKALN